MLLPTRFRHLPDLSGIALKLPKFPLGWQDAFLSFLTTCEKDPALSSRDCPWYQGKGYKVGLTTCKYTIWCACSNIGRLDWHLLQAWQNQIRATKTIDTQANSDDINTSEMHVFFLVNADANRDGEKLWTPQNHILNLLRLYQLHSSPKIFNTGGGCRDLRTLRAEPGDPRS